MFEAEATGALLTLWLLENMAETNGKKVSLFIDNQSVILALKKNSSSPGQYLMHGLKLAIARSNCNLTIKWISSHSEVTGNEMADHFAKKTSEGLLGATSTFRVSRRIERFKDG